MKANTFKPKFEQKLDSPENQLKLIQVSGNRDHDYYKLYFKDKYVLLIKISRGSKEWGNGLLRLVARNLGISISELQGIVSCSFGTAEFLARSKHLANQ